MSSEVKSRKSKVYRQVDAYSLKGGHTIYPATSTETWTNWVTKGQNYPNWRIRILHHINATTDLAGVEEIHSPVSVNASHTIKSINKGWINFPWYDPIVQKTLSGQAFLGLPSARYPSEVRADNAAKAKFVNKALNELNSFQGGVFAGELRETIRLVRSPLKALRGGLSGYLASLRKRKQRRGPPKVVKKNNKRILSETWLEYSFGMIPLVNDINDAMNALKRDYYTRHKYVSASGKDAEKPLLTWTNISAATAPSINVYKRDEDWISVKYYGSVGVESPSLVEPRNLGFSLRDFVPTAWELLPWSFLVDYFTNIGDVVNSVRIKASDLDWVARTLVKQRSSTFVGHYAAPVPTNYKLVYSRASGGSSHIKEVLRQPYTGDLVPRFQFEFPGIGKKWLNIAALSRTARRSTPYY